MVGEHIVECVNENGKRTQQVCKTRYAANLGISLADTTAYGVTIRKSNREDVFIKLTGEQIE